MSFQVTDESLQAARKWIDSYELPVDLSNLINVRLLRNDRPSWNNKAEIKFPFRTYVLEYFAERDGRPSLYRFTNDQGKVYPKRWSTGDEVVEGLTELFPKELLEKKLNEELETLKEKRLERDKKDGEDAYKRDPFRWTSQERVDRYLSLKSNYDPDYRYSDDPTIYKQQSLIDDELKLIESVMTDSEKRSVGL